MESKLFYETPSINGMDPFESALLSMNKIDAKDEKAVLPDIGVTITPEYYINHMEPIQKGKEFVDIIKKNHGKKFFVIGDYDCDGIFATTIMSVAISACGESSFFTAPNRFTDGYGMKKSHIDEAIKTGASVIITVDNGISAIDEIDYAKSKGLTVIVTDHHLPPKGKKNNADLIIDPWVNDDSFKDISGATVAFKLANALYGEFGFLKTFLINFMDLAGISCFSDVMTMTGENRLLAKATMANMNEEVSCNGSFSRRLADMLDYYVPGKSSYNELSLDGVYRDFDKDNIDFYFVPIINAANRVVGDVNSLIYDIAFLFSFDYSGYPHVYRDMNKERKFMRTELLRMHKKNDSKAVVEVLSPNSTDNYSGISGLVASDVVDSEGKPALIGLPDKDGFAKFSGRSVRGYNLYEALDRISSDHPEFQIKFGGHAEALGMRCKESDVPEIQALLSDDFEKSGIKQTSETQYYDAGINIASIKALFEKFSPFGPGFQFPKFYTEGSVMAYDIKRRTFTVDSIGNESITVYGYDDFNYVTSRACSPRANHVKLTYSLMHDATGNVCLKVDHFVK